MSHHSLMTLTSFTFSTRWGQYQSNESITFLPELDCWVWKFFGFNGILNMKFFWATECTSKNSKNLVTSSVKGVKYIFTLPKIAIWHTDVSNVEKIMAQSTKHRKLSNKNIKREKPWPLFCIMLQWINNLHIIHINVNSISSNYNWDTC